MYIDRELAKTRPPRVVAILPLLLVIGLAIIAIGLSPATSQVCMKLVDFPCGP